MDLLTNGAMDGGSQHCTAGSDQKPSPRKRNGKRQNDCLRRPYKQLRREVKSKGEKKRYTHLNAEFQKIARRDKKAFLSDHCKEIEEKQNRMGIEWERLEISSRKLEIPWEHFMQRWHNKGQKLWT